MQASLFDDPPRLPPGLVYQAGFLAPAEEASAIEIIQALPLAEAQYRQYTARRRVASYGGSYDFDANRLMPAEALPASLWPLREKVADWAGLPPEALAHVLVAGYRPGTPLGWHRDVPDFEDVFGVSLGTSATLRFRPYPPIAPKKADILRLQAEPRSVYRIAGPARWDWQHSVAPTEALRWSITFRTKRR